MEDKNKLERYEIEICYLHEHLLQQEFIIQKKEILLQKYIKIIQEEETALKKKNEEVKKHLASFRYQAGTCLYEATQSFTGFLMLPVKLMKLYIRHKKSK